MNEQQRRALQVKQTIFRLFARNVEVSLSGMAIELALELEFIPTNLTAQTINEMIDDGVLVLNAYQSELSLTKLGKEVCLINNTANN